MVEFTAGYIAGAAGAVCCHPFDTLRTYQATNGLSWGATARKAVSSPGWIGRLYSGVFSQCATLGAYRAISLGVTKHLMSKVKGEPTLWQLAGASAFAGSVGALVIGPSEIVKTRAMVDQSAGSSFWAGLQREYRALRSLSAKDLACALRIIAVRDAGGNAFFMLTYEALFQAGRRRLDSGSGSTLAAAMAAGAVAGPMGWITVYPIEIYRIKLQTETQPVSPESLLARVQRFHGGKGIGGISQWWRGCPGCCLRSVIQIPITMGAFEMCRSAMTGA